MLSKTLISAIAAASLCAISQGQIKSLGVGKSVRAVTLDPKSFSPMIDVSFRPNQFEKEHEMMFNYPAGMPNNLIAGGLLIDPRVTPGFATSFPGISATGYEPPDPDIAVGPNHIVEVVNSNIAFFKKDGTKLLEQTEQNFFKSVNPEAFDFDPKIIYDQVAKRFIALDLGLNDASSGGTASLIIGVSNTSDPMGTWKLYKVDVKQTSGSNNYWWDYPGLGYNKDMIAMSGNMFAMQGSSGFNGVQLVVFDKATLFGGTATPNKFQVADGFTVQLAKTEDATSQSLYGVETRSGTSMRLTAITKSGSSFTVSQAVVPVPAWQRDIGSITGPSGVIVQTNDPRTLVAASASGRILATHTVAVSNSDSRPSARWYDFKTNNWPASGTPSLFQSGQVDPPSGHGYSFPAINIDIKGGIGMVFSKIGTSTPGQLMATGRKPTDPAGTMGLPVVIGNSTSGKYNGFSTRWGDYHDVEVDPTDSKTFWAVGMGAGPSGKWLTLINNFKVTATDAELLRVNPNAIAIVAGSLVTGNKTSLFSTDSNNLGIQTLQVSGLGQVAGFSAAYQLPFTGAVDTLRVSLQVAGSSGSSALISLLNKTTGRYDQVITLGLSPLGVTKVLDLTPSQIALYVNSSNQVSLIARAVNPNRSNAAPVPFQFNTDQAVLLTAPS